MVAEKEKAVDKEKEIKERTWKKDQEKKIKERTWEKDEMVQKEKENTAKMEEKNAVDQKEMVCSETYIKAEK